MNDVVWLGFFPPQNIIIHSVILLQPFVTDTRRYTPVGFQTSYSGELVPGFRTTFSSSAQFKSYHCKASVGLPQFRCAPAVENGCPDVAEHGSQTCVIEVFWSYHKKCLERARGCGERQKPGLSQEVSPAGGSGGVAHIHDCSSAEGDHFNHAATSWDELDYSEIWKMP